MIWRDSFSKSYFNFHLGGGANGSCPVRKGQGSPFPGQTEKGNGRAAGGGRGPGEYNWLNLLRLSSPSSPNRR